ncbi:MAG: hypothetical protein WAU47_11030 [Desulfobaccales bacterium]
MRFLEKWQAVWMAATFAEAGEPETAREIYQSIHKRSDERVTDRQRPTPRQNIYRT